MLLGVTVLGVVLGLTDRGTAQQRDLAVVGLLGGFVAIVGGPILLLLWQDVAVTSEAITVRNYLTRWRKRRVLLADLHGIRRTGFGTHAGVRVDASGAVLNIATGMFSAAAERRMLEAIQGAAPTSVGEQVAQLLGRP